MDYDLRSALAYAHSGRIEDWVHAYLMGDPWANPAPSEGLKREPRWWAEPVELPDAAPPSGL